MPDRYRLSRNKLSASRKEKKRRFIRIKNKIRTGNGVYYTYHVEEDNDFQTWIDIYFLSKKRKGVYYAAALCTPDCIASDMLQNAALKEVDKILPYTGDEFRTSVKIPKTHPKQPQTYRWYPSELLNRRHELWTKIEEEMSGNEFTVTPQIKIDPSYYPPAIGCLATVNTPSLTPKAIIEFIEFFRTVAEPITVLGKNPSIVWKGEEVKRVPAEFNKRYKEYRDAQPNSD